MKVIKCNRCRIECREEYCSVNHSENFDGEPDIEWHLCEKCYGELLSFLAGLKVEAAVRHNPQDGP